MIYRRFGRTEIPLSVLSCGGMRYQQSWRADSRVSADSQANLEATVDRALEVGIHHFETARGYGTSEVQLGRALARHPRERFVLQSKVQPDEDPAVFERNLIESFARLGVERLDLFAFHGLNEARSMDLTLRRGGCLEVVEGLRKQGRIGHVGFSTHAPCRLIVEAIETGRFDYVNLHHYFIFQDNHPAVLAARRQDLGVFIISPSDKGGRLYDPPDKLRQACAPLDPMVFNDLFCLNQPDVHTLSVGAARPSDFDLHVAALELLPRADQVVAPVVERLEAMYRQTLGDEFATRWREGLPDWDQMPGLPNVRLILSLRNLALAWDLLRFARDRYANLTGSDRWVQGGNAAQFDEAALDRALTASPFRRQIPGLLREAHVLLGGAS